MSIAARAARWSVATLGAVTFLAGCSLLEQSGADIDSAAVESAPTTWAGQDGTFDRPQIKVVSPADGSTVTGQFTMTVALESIRPAPAGRVRHGEGHWSVLVNRPCIAAGEPIPIEDNDVKVVGDGTLTGDLTLGPGVHELCVQVSDGYHIATNIRDSITVTVGRAGGSS